MRLNQKGLRFMIAENYYQKALANFSNAKLTMRICASDEEQVNIAAYHLQQALELVIKHLFLINGQQIQKTHDIDQLIIDAKNKGIDLMLSDYIIEHAEAISNWESKTRYIMGFKLEVDKVNRMISELDNYFSKLSKILTF